MYRERYYYALLALAMSVSMPSCTREEGTGEPGSTVVFRASTEYDNGPATKTSYSGIVYGGKERIDWVTGDKIRIYSDVATCPDGTPYCDYQVTGVRAGTAVESDESSSYATIAQLRPNGLQWGTGDHSFYSIYPSPVQNGNIEFTSANVVSATLPSTQTYTVSGTTLKPSMDYAYMYASVKTGAASTVKLAYKPMFTAFQFTVDSRDDASITITSFTLSSESTAMAGDFTATLTAATASASSTVVYDFTDADAADVRSVTLSFGSGVTIVQGSPVTFTVFALPRTYNDLTATFTTSAGETKSLALKEGSSWISFTAGHKYDITSFGLPGEWIYTLSDLTGLTMTAHTGTMHTLSSSFKSYRQRGGVQEPLAYEIQYYDETEAEWKSGLPGWLVANSPSSFNGSSTGEDLTLDVAPQPIQTLSEATQRGTSPTSTFNLASVNPSLPRSTNPGGWDHPYVSDDYKSANCYVINAPGYYSFPLQWGNSRSNTSAYTSTQTGADFLTIYKDYLGQGITTSWIVNTGDPKKLIIPGSKESGKPVTAELLWTDSPRLVENVAISPNPSLRYITFEVPRDFITRGNALIALKEAEPPYRIIWSWHIWVTDADLSETVTNNGYAFAPVPLGWTGGSDTYTARSCSLRVYQPASGYSSDPIVISQPAGTTNPYVGDCPYYQFGRKDPLLPSTGTNNTDKAYYPTSSDYEFKRETGRTTIANGIQHPTTFYGYGTGVDEPYDYCTTPYCNMWNSTIDGWGSATWESVAGDGQYPKTSERFDSPVTKTVYDPSPMGFKVPPPAAFTGFKKSNFIWTGDYGRIFTNDSGDKLFLPAMGGRDRSDGTLNGVRRYGFYWTALAYSQSLAIMTYYYEDSNSYPLHINNRVSRSYGRTVLPVKE